MPVRGNVAHSTGRRTGAGCRTARAGAIMPPIDEPGTSGRAGPGVPMRALAWPARASMVSGTGRAWVRPVPALSKVTTRSAGPGVSASRGSRVCMVPP